MKKCPYCAEEIQEAAIKCRFCGEWFEKQENVLNEEHSQKNNSTEKINVSSYRKDIPLHRTDNIPTPEDVIYCLKAAEQGDEISQDRLGEMYLEGIGVPQDYAEAEKWFRKAAEQGHAHAQYWLAFILEAPLGVPQDYAEAEKWFRKAAEQGDLEAQHYMGLKYEEGIGVTQDDVEAVKWYRKTAEQGDVLSIVRLGVIYFYGKSIPQDYAEAVRWFRHAADQGDVWSCNRLGWMYEEGIGVTQDYVEAAKWYLKAAEQGNEDAQLSLDQMNDKHKYFDTDVDSNLLQHDQASEDNSIHSFDLTETVGNEEDVIQDVVLPLPDGSIYYGPLVNGESTGHGTLKFPEGSKYEGQFIKGCPNGSGTFTYRDGVTMSGKWRDGKIIEDDVTMIFSKGKYIGPVKEMGPGEYKFNGYGTLFTEGTEIYAYWENSNPIGKVKMIFPDNSKYEGDVKNMLPHGKGVLSFPDSMTYEGDFINGMFHGRGTVIDSNGNKMGSKLWREGKPI